LTLGLARGDNSVAQMTALQTKKNSLKKASTDFHHSTHCMIADSTLQLCSTPSIFFTSMERI
jgi:hypothetical protein